MASAYLFNLENAKEEKCLCERGEAISQDWRCSIATGVEVKGYLMTYFADSTNLIAIRIVEQKPSQVVN